MGFETVTPLSDLESASVHVCRQTQVANLRLCAADVGRIASDSQNDSPRRRSMSLG